MPELLAPERAVNTFRNVFGLEPEWVAMAPGRVNLIGEHTDYNGGFVLPMAIERETALAGARTEDRLMVLHSTSRRETITIDLTVPLVPGKPRWANYVRGVAAGFQRVDVPLSGLRVVIDSDVPMGGGLSSSAALEVAAASLLEAVTGHTLDPVAKALLCQHAEHEFAGVPCGIMDQFTVTLARAGHALLLDCRSYMTEHVPIADPDLVVLIVNTNVKHDLAAGEYARRRAQCEEAARGLGVPSLREATLPMLALAEPALDPVVARRARHVITENTRTLDAADAMRRGDWAQMGDLMYRSHASLCDDYQVSSPELDTVVEIAQEMGVAGGVWGCRMTGGGFGGCAVALVQAGALDEVMEHVAASYQRRAARAATMFSSRPAAGTHVAPGKAER
ncbi:MAG: galactokinase [Vicinamibacterales bacterium]